MEFTLPQTNADLLPFAAAAATVLFGVFAMFAPRLTLRLLRLTTLSLHPEAVAEARATIGGFYIGTGLMALLLFDQPMVQMVLGAAWLFAAFGRLVSILSDQGGTAFNVVALVLALALAGLPFASAFGFVSS